jgi:hypothetical protein
MNDRKRAWQILHKEILRVADGTPTDDAWANEMAAIMSGAEKITRPPDQTRVGGFVC